MPALSVVPTDTVLSATAPAKLYVLPAISALAVLTAVSVVELVPSATPFGVSASVLLPIARASIAPACA
nr:MAG TPA: hypothetical protein [Caudoviricetes sp.]